MKCTYLVKLTALTALLVFGCNSGKRDLRPQKPDSVTTENNVVKPAAVKKQTVTIDKLKDGFFVESTVEDTGGFFISALMILKRGSVVLFKETTTTCYTFSDSLNPQVIKAGGDKYEVLLEMDKGPNKNTLRRFFINGNKVTAIDTLPTFLAKARDLDDDGIPEYAGFWDYSQIWGYYGSLTAYNPMLYYSVTPEGLVLDSNYTRTKNAEVYGKFYGFMYSENIEIPTKKADAMDKEIERITKQ